MTDVVVTFRIEWGTFTYFVVLDPSPGGLKISRDPGLDISKPNAWSFLGGCMRNRPIRPVDLSNGWLNSRNHRHEECLRRSRSGVVDGRFEISGLMIRTRSEREVRVEPPRLQDAV